MVREAECPCEERPGSPHTRGDGPEQGRAQSLQDLFSPHAWGWSAQTNPILRYKMVLPTRVGMVRPLPTSARYDCSSTHTRGDGPEFTIQIDAVNGFSPHRWGSLSTPLTYSLIAKVRHWCSVPDVSLFHFRESPVFTKAILELLSDDDYSALQHRLMQNPTAGDLIKGGGGLRKIRCAAKGRGKNGGIRVIYYLANETFIYLVTAYAKNKQETLTAKQLSILSEHVKKETL